MMSSTHSNNKKVKRSTSVMKKTKREGQDTEERKRKRVQSELCSSVGGSKQKKNKQNKPKVKEEIRKDASGLSSCKKEENKV